MCMLTFLEPGASPDVDALHNGAERNPDGHGFAIVSGNTLLVERGMNPDQMITMFAAMREQHPYGPALFHSRYGTHGTLDVANCHPFRLGPDGRTVLAHNGILSTDVHPVGNDIRSDTRIAAEDFLPTEPFGSFGTRRNRDRLAAWLGPHNKIVILTVNPRYRRHSYLINEEAGLWEDGIWYSNYDYLAYEEDDHATYPAGWQGAGNRYDFQQGMCFCPVCGTEHDPVLWYCGECGACPECGRPHIYCPCWGVAMTRS